MSGEGAGGYAYLTQDVPPWAWCCHCSRSLRPLRSKTGRRGLVRLARFTNMSMRSGQLGAYRRTGWKTVKTLPCATGEQAWLIERAVLARLWERGLPKGYLTAQEMPDGGWTETADRKVIDERQLWNMVRDEAVLVSGKEDLTD